MSGKGRCRAPVAKTQAPSTPPLQVFNVLVVIMTWPQTLNVCPWIPRKMFKALTFSFEALHDHLALIKRLSATETPRNRQRQCLALSPPREAFLCLLVHSPTVSTCDGRLHLATGAPPACGGSSPQLKTGGNGWINTPASWL